MDIKKAHEVSQLVKEVETLNNKIKWVKEFIEKCDKGVNFDHYDKGELRFITDDRKYYNIILKEQKEVVEIANLILSYYENKRDATVEDVYRL